MTLVLSELLSNRITQLIMRDLVGDGRYGQLAFTSTYRKEHISLIERTPSESQCLHLRHYLNDGPAQIRSCADRCRQWTYLYNGSHPPISDAIRMLQGEQQQVEEVEPNGEALEGMEDDEAERKFSTPSPPVNSEYTAVDPADVYSYCMAQLTTCRNLCCSVYLPSNNTSIL